MMFRYEANWSLEKDYEEVIRSVWHERPVDRVTPMTLQSLLEGSKGPY